MYSSNYNSKNTLKRNEIKKLYSTNTSPSTSHRPKTTIAVKEEDIQIKIPTQYPQARYITIENPTLKNSEYTSILNEKYPPRKYLQLNQLSSDNISKWKKNDINLTFLNPKLNYSDYNLKALTYKNEEIIPSKMTNLQEAIDIVDKLQKKLIEYEETNNENIQKANEVINRIKEENEIYPQKINELYENMRIIEEKYDIDYPDPDDPMNIVVSDFRRGRLKRNLFYFLMNRINRQKDIRFRYYEMLIRRENNLKLKALIGFERMQNVNIMRKNNEQKNEMSIVKRIFDSLKANVLINYNERKLYDIQKTLYQSMYIKELKLKMYILKGYKSQNKKALFNYYYKTLRKVLKALIYNAIHNKNQKEISILDTNPNYLQFAKELSIKYGDKLTNEMKGRKVKGMKMLKDFYDKMHIKSLSKMVNSPFTNKIMVLTNYFHLWRKGSKENYKSITLQMSNLNKLLKSFFKRAKLFCMHKHYKIILNNHVKKKSITMFLNITLRKFKLKNKIELYKRNRPLIIKKAIFSKMLKKTKLTPLTKFNYIKRRLLYESFIEKLKHSLKASFAINTIKKNIYLYNNIYPDLLKKIAIFTLKHKIIKENQKRNRINNFIYKSYSSKYINIMRRFAFKKKQIEIRARYENTILSIRQILTEKASMINKLKYDNDHLTYNNDQTIMKIQTLASENDALRSRIVEIKQQTDFENKKYEEMIYQYEKDLNCLKLTAENHKSLLQQAEKRGEILQKKYSNDIDNAKNLHQNLKEIIQRKNQQLMDLKKIKAKENEEVNYEKEMLKKENEMLLYDLSNMIELREKEKNILHEETIKMLNESKMILGKYSKENNKDINDRENS